MQIQNKDKSRIGEVFYCITEDDPPHLVYMGSEYTLFKLRELAKEYGEDVYWCCNYGDRISQECVYSAGNRAIEHVD